MKKFIKVFLLILFIVFVLGITTSNAAYRVTADTTASEMLQQLNSGVELTGISQQIRDQNPYLLCRNSNMELYEGGVYSFVNGDANSSKETYPEFDANGNVLNDGYAKAYILAAPGYIKSDTQYSGLPTPADERQWAWYCIIGQVSGSNDLYNIAIAYQNYKKTEKDITLTSDANAKTSVSGENIVYGPIQIEYSYGKGTSGSKSDEWGGFNYAFFDENGNNISNKIRLCTSSNNTYTDVTSVGKTTDGYYKVRTSDYSKQSLYIVTNDKTISKVNIKIQANIVDYKVTLYAIEGEYDAGTKGGYRYCAACRTNGSYYNYGGKLYEFESSGYADKSGPYTSVPNNQIRLYSGNTVSTINTNTKAQVVSTDTRYQPDGRTNLYTSRSAAAQNVGNRIISANPYRCSKCGQSIGNNNNMNYLYSHNQNAHVKPVSVYFCRILIYKYNAYNGCGSYVYGGKHPYQCDGGHYDGGMWDSQYLHLIDTTSENKSTEAKLDVEIELAVTIEVEKVWDDASNAEGIRPENINFVVYRSLDQENWTKLTESTDYNVSWTSKTGDTWKANITGLMRIDDNGNYYYFKVEEADFEENSKADEYYRVSYKSGDYTDGKIEQVDVKKITITNTKVIDLGGYVWLDGQTGIKPAVPNNGIMDDGETRLENIVVYLYYRDPNTDTVSKIAETVTDANGHYEFEKVPMGNYYVEFEYDGIHYANTISGGNSKAFEADTDRNTFNGRFETITYKQSNDGTTLNYDYSDKKSTLITNEEGSTRIADEFIMNAATQEEKIVSTVDDLNLGLVKRGTDIALSTDVYDAKVTINGQTTDYTFNKEDNSIEIGTTETNEEVSYNLNLYTSDYNYRIREYVNTQDFKEKDYINNENPGITTGDDLKVRVIYELNLQNQSTETTRINEVKYTYDEKYTFIGLQDSSYSVQDLGNVVTINFGGLPLTEGETKTAYLVFEVNETDNAVNLGDFTNKAEITSYSTDKGLIDVDSQPGNFINDNQVEDDSDTAGGLTITVPSNVTRVITGKVFDADGNNVNDVIVQLIELKTVNGKTYEYIWQETVSGTENGLRLNANGTALETYSYSKADGYYEFKGFIPGDYIVRFIYGDGTTYDMTGNVIKYNGQDYKSMPDSNYKAEWYNASSYTAGASVARDNEARRLETMAYSVDVNASKGVLLKLLNNLTVDEINETEKEIIIATYNYYYDPDITEVTSDVINALLKDQVLRNTWMCAETSKIKVAVDVEETDFTNTTVSTEVNGISTTYKNNITDINFGLELRPVTKIELKKYITGMKLVASNGQTLVNAYIDVNEYFDNPVDISNKVQGIKDNVTILNTVWQYEVPPTDINTVVDGANLQFEYTLVVKNTSDTDYLSSDLANAYNDSDIGTYKTTLTNKAAEIKGYIRNGAYRTQIGNSVGSSYYVGGNGEAKVLTEVTNIRDYINNDLTFITSDGEVAEDESAPKTHRILRDDYSMQAATINTILKTTKTTGKMENNGAVVLYKVTLGKNPISSTGNLSFENYIAEVMSYTNSAGRRSMTSTPGNAEIIDQYPNETVGEHEIDEADTARIQIGVRTGDDATTNFIIIIAVAAGIAVVAIGAYVIKKYFLK